jgi:hypothetical protein
MKTAEQWETELDTVQRIHLNKTLRAIQTDALRWAAVQCSALDDHAAKRVIMEKVRDIEEPNAL